MDQKTETRLLRSPARRQLLAGMAVAFVLKGTVASLWAEAPMQNMQKVPGKTENEHRTVLHQEVEIQATPQRIYDDLLDAKKFTSFTGVLATIDRNAGGAFSLFGGLIVGRNVELIPTERIVQAWRPTHWPDGVYSIVRFELKPQGSATTVILDHTGFPEGEFDHLEWGWNNHYWEPLKKYVV